MPLQKLQFKPGIVRELTSLTGEGGWFACDKVRFRSGMPEKIGGWIKDTGLPDSTLKPSSGSFWGIARSLWNWLTLSGRKLISIGTNYKFYIQDGPNGPLYDVTPIRFTTAAGGATFAATAGSANITVTVVNHGAQTGDFVTFSGAVSLGGNITASVLNREFQITYLTANTFQITASATATGSDTGNGGAATVAAFQLTTGNAIAVTASGWGAGAWGSSGWGEAAATGVAYNLRLWSESNYGQDLIMNPRGGGLYLWAVNVNPNIFDRAGLLSNTSSGIYQTDAYCPSVCNFVIVSDVSRFVIALGCNDLGSTTLDPMLIRWSAQEDYTKWYPAVTNQAGSIRLSFGSEIVGAIQTREEILVWTDTALYSLQYVGPPYVWAVKLLGSNTSIESPRAMIAANNVVFWMGTDKFYRYDGSVRTLPCAIWQYIFNDINTDQAFQVFAGTVERYQEVWWFYCSTNSKTIDRYVIYNYVENTWVYGTMARTAWLDSIMMHNPLATGYGTSTTELSGTTLVHEYGVDDGSTTPASPISAYITSSDFDIGDGHNFGLVWRIIPDLTFDGSKAAAPQVTFTMLPRNAAGDAYKPSTDPTVVSANNYSSQRSYLVQRFTPLIYSRVRGRQMAFQISSDTLGTQWQLGTPRIDIRPDGRR